MSLIFLSQTLICLGAPRMAAATLEALLFGRWTLQESHKRFAAAYWSLFHAVSAYIIAEVIYFGAAGRSIIEIVLIFILSLAAYALMFIFPAYRSQLSFQLQIMDQTMNKKPHESTKNLFSLMKIRVGVGFSGLSILAVSFLIRFLAPMIDFAQVSLDYLFDNIAWLFWSIAGISAFLLLVSLFYALMMLIAYLRNKFKQLTMEKKLGRKLTDEEIMGIIMNPK